YLMNNQIKHRGPDDEGYYVETEQQQLVLAGDDSQCDGQLIYTQATKLNDYLELPIELGLGHRRLSIVDLSPQGHQPLAREQGDYWISYNGEVYNYLELRQELEQLGYKFISATDTEVILAAYQQWGSQCLGKFNGMFSFIIYDRVRQQLFIARDRFGVKPLYYYSDSNGVYLASEIKQFSQLPNWKAQLNHQLAYDFLAHGLSDHTNQTLFTHVNQLAGGEYVLVNRSSFTSIADFVPVSWYQLPQQATKLSYAQAKSEFAKLFTDAVKLRLRADVKIGSCLSGGLDSSAIVSTMAPLLAKQKAQELLNTFSACSEHKQFDEREYIEEVVKHTQAKAFYCYPSLENLFNINESLTWHQDEPFGSTSIFAQWSVFEYAKSQQVSVMLDGQGADEQLAGYQGLYFQIYLNQLLSQAKFSQFIRELSALHKLHKLSLKAMLLRSLISLFPVSFKHKLGNILGKQQYSTNWLNSGLRYQPINPYLVNGLNNRDVEQTLRAQLSRINLSMLLHWEDRDSMAHSVESRVPFLDYRLVEFLASLPTEYKIKNGISKRILRDSLTNIMPSKITNRLSKLGFATPEEIWVKQHQELFRSKLIEAIELCPQIFVREQVLAIFDEIIAGKRQFDFWLWRIISFATWVKIFAVEL
ncbi:MAG: hypothetical protein RLZZ293_855, partial [Pseudomonadota bacterium]